MTIDEAVAALDALDDYDAESAHIKADDIVAQMLPPEVRDAYDRAASRVGFWYA